MHLNVTIRPYTSNTRENAATEPPRYRVVTGRPSLARLARRAPQTLPHRECWESGVSPYTPHAQIARNETLYGRLTQPTPAELVVIDAYRATYLQAFGVQPAGTHWVDGLQVMVLLRRDGGLPPGRWGRRAAAIAAHHN